MFLAENYFLAEVLLCRPQLAYPWFSIMNFISNLEQYRGQEHSGKFREK